MITDREFRDISDITYCVDSKYCKNFIKKEDFILENRYKVFDVENNRENGLQAMAVFPIIDYRLDTSIIIISYGGTNIRDIKDIKTDLEILLFYTTKKIFKEDLSILERIEGQLESANAFYENIRNNYRDSKIFLTGHSLGGYIAILVASKYRVPATIFNAPNPITRMDEAQKRWILDNAKLYKSFHIIGDDLGNFGYDDELSDLNIVRWVEENGEVPGLFSVHSLQSYSFNDDGEIILD